MLMSQLFTKRGRARSERFGTFVPNGAREGANNAVKTVEGNTNASRLSEVGTQLVSNVTQRKVTRNSKMDTVSSLKLNFEGPLPPIPRLNTNSRNDQGESSTASRQQ